MCSGVSLHVLPVLTATALLAAFLYTAYFSAQRARFQGPTPNKQPTVNAFKHLSCSSSTCHGRLAHDTELWT